MLKGDLSCCQPLPAIKLSSPHHFVADRQGLGGPRRQPLRSSHPTLCDTVTVRVNIMGTVPEVRPCSKAFPGSIHLVLTAS